MLGHGARHTGSENWNPFSTTVTPPPRASLDHTALETLFASTRSFEGVDFSYCDLRERKMRGRDFKDAILIHARLDGVDLSGARLAGAVLTDASLVGADMRSADLTRAVLERYSANGGEVREELIADSSHGPFIDHVDDCARLLWGFVTDHTTARP